MTKPRWRVGEKLGRTLYRNEVVVGMVDTPELAAEIVAAMNGAARNDREGICAMLAREANRIYHSQEQDYPSNTLDVVGFNLRSDLDDMLTVRKHPSGKGLERP